MHINVIKVNSIIITIKKVCPVFAWRVIIFCCIFKRARNLFTFAAFHRYCLISKLVQFDGENISERHGFTPIMTIHDSCPVIENLRVNHSNYIS